MFIQFLAQLGGPYSGGQSHQRQPLFNTCTMPLMTRRSSARSTPRTSVVGEVRSASTAHRSAKIDFCARSRSPPKTNQDRIVRAEELMSFDPIILIRLVRCIAELLSLPRLALTDE